MITRYSTCHFAEVMDYYFIEKTMPPTKTLTPKCSFCGELCELVPTHSVVNENIEVVLRRWKDGDTNYTKLVEKLDSSLWGPWYTAFSSARETLQATGTPAYIRKEYSMEWVKADDPVSDLVVKSPEATDE